MVDNLSRMFQFEDVPMPSVVIYVIINFHKAFSYTNIHQTHGPSLQDIVPKLQLRTAVGTSYFAHAGMQLPI